MEPMQQYSDYGIQLTVEYMDADGTSVTASSTTLQAAIFAVNISAQFVLRFVKRTAQPVSKF